jgi:hypothetical protein
MMTTENIYGTLTDEDLLGIPDKIKDGIKDLKDSKVEVVEIVPKAIEDELKELKGEVKRLTKIVDNFKKFYSNWHMFKHQLGL